ncbi:Fructose-2,6-bisphosphatase [Dispira simplex]|nr:Fructose-2,6-bisphosphatase [Dispira simplex]
MTYAVSGHARVACVMVGLPARGKTYVAQKVCRYLQWMGIATKVFNVGNYRRETVGADQKHSFFDPANTEAAQCRLQCALEALGDMLRWFEEENGVVGIYDATNSTQARRQLLQIELEKCGIQPMFIESVCDDERIILDNIMQVKLNSPDYAHMTDSDSILADFRARIGHYEQVYEPVQEEDLSFVKMINVGSKVIINRIQGYLQSRVVYYLMNLHISPRAIFFSRHGESTFNITGKLGGDSDLSPRGRKYSEALPGLISKHLDGQTLTVWTSTMRRTIQTGQHLPYPKLTWKALDELDAGVCDGLTYEEVEQQYPEDFAMRDNDKFNYRYPGGESYRDVVLRLEPVIMELERQHNILIIGHQAVLRCIYAYYLNYTHDELPYIKIPLHTVLKLTPRAYGCDVEQYRFDIEAVDTYRANPKRPSSLRRVGSLRRAAATSQATTTAASGLSPLPAQLGQLNANLPNSPLIGISPPVSASVSRTGVNQPRHSNLNSAGTVHTFASKLANKIPVGKETSVPKIITNISSTISVSTTPTVSDHPSPTLPPSRGSLSDKVDVVNGVGVTSLKAPFSVSFTDAPDSAADKLENGDFSDSAPPSPQNPTVNNYLATLDG